MNAGRTAARLLTYSAAGWGIESFWRRKPPRSPVWGGQDVPFLPIYGLGALLALAMQERMKNVSLPLRFAAYAAGLTGFEWLSCKAGRAIYGYVGWEYQDGSCIDVPHALAWGGLGLVLEKADPAIFGQRP